MFKPLHKRACLLLTLLLMAAGVAHAAPDTQPGDAVLHLLKDKGLLPDPAQLAAQLTTQMEASPVMQQVRDTASELVMSAMNFLGVRYRRGGMSAEQGFDCSGFTRYVFENSVGLVLPRRADQQAKEAGLKDIKKEELRPGDLVFFNTMRRAFSHVGIYVGEGKFIHAPRAGGEVRVEDMRAAYWTKRFNGARRADLPAPQLNAQP
jgi:cell wall-associated NlpC family hydrolase